MPTHSSLYIATTFHFAGRQENKSVSLSVTELTMGRLRPTITRRAPQEAVVLPARLEHIPHCDNNAQRLATAISLPYHRITTSEPRK